MKGWGVLAGIETRTLTIPICLDCLDNHCGGTALLACGHRFGTRCAAEWASASTGGGRLEGGARQAAVTCPLCRRALTEEQVSRLQLSAGRDLEQRIDLSAYLAGDL